MTHAQRCRAQRDQPVVGRSTVDDERDAPVVDATAAKIHLPRGDAANVEVLGWPLTDTATPSFFHNQLKVDLGTAVSSAGRLPPLTPVRAVPVA